MFVSRLRGRDQLCRIPTIEEKKKSVIWEKRCERLLVSSDISFLCSLSSDIGNTIM